MGIFNSVAKAATATAKSGYRLSTITLRFMRDIFRAYYSLAGQYTLPLEEAPPKLQDLNVFGQVFLWLAFIPELALLLSVTLFPLIGNSILSVKTFFIKTYNFTLPLGYKLDAAEDNRTIIRHAYGLPGLILGGIVLGVPVALISLTTRVLINTIETGLILLGQAANIVLHKDNEIEFITNRTIAGIILGLPGYAIAAFPALLLMSAISFGRIVANSVKTSGRLLVSASNLVLHKEDSIPKKYDMGKDQRSGKLHILGIPGFIIGAIPALIVMGGLGFGRIVTNTAKTTFMLWVTASNLVLHKDNEIPENLGIKWDVRREFKQQVLGSLGFFVAIPIALITMGLFSLGRIITNTIKTTIKLLVSASNLVLHEQDAISEAYSIGSDLRPGKQLILGTLGYLIAAIPAFISVGTILLIRFVSHNLKSFRALSASLLNIATERELFNTTGVGADDRPGLNKAVGSLGYLAAVGITGAVSSLILVTRKIPNLFAVIIGLVGTIGIVPAKLFFGKDPKKKFESNADDLNEKEMEVIQSFKDINSVLTWDGQLVPGNAITKRQTGVKTNAAFARKCITLNAKSVTEQTLDDLLEAYKDSNDKVNFFISEAFLAAVDKIKRDHYGNNCLTTGKEFRESTAEVDAVAAFVKDYMDKIVGQEMTEKIVPTDLYEKCRTSYTSLFWAKRAEAPVDDGGASPAPGSA